MLLTNTDYFTQSGTASRPVYENITGGFKVFNKETTPTFEELQSANIKSYTNTTTQTVKTPALNYYVTHSGQSYGYKYIHYGPLSGEWILGSGGNCTKISELFIYNGRLGALMQFGGTSMLVEDRISYYLWERGVYSYNYNGNIYYMGYDVDTGNVYIGATTKNSREAIFSGILDGNYPHVGEYLYDVFVTRDRVLSTVLGLEPLTPFKCTVNGEYTGHLQYYNSETQKFTLPIGVSPKEDMTAGAPLTYYTVTFDSMGGTEFEPIRVPIDNPYLPELPIPTYSDDQWEFVDWMSGQYYGFPFYEGDEIRGNITLYARYRRVYKRDGDGFPNKYYVTASLLRLYGIYAVDPTDNYNDIRYENVVRFCEIIYSHFSEGLKADIIACAEANEPSISRLYIPVSIYNEFELEMDAMFTPDLETGLYPYFTYVTDTVNYYQYYMLDDPLSTLKFNVNEETSDEPALVDYSYGIGAPETRLCYVIENAKSFVYQLTYYTIEVFSNTDMTFFERIVSYIEAFVGICADAFDVLKAVWGAIPVAPRTFLVACFAILLAGGIIAKILGG